MLCWKRLNFPEVIQHHWREIGLFIFVLWHVKYVFWWTYLPQRSWFPAHLVPTLSSIFWVLFSRAQRRSQPNSLNGLKFTGNDTFTKGCCVFFSSLENEIVHFSVVFIDFQRHSSTSPWFSFIFHGFQWFLQGVHQFLHGSHPCFPWVHSCSLIFPLFS